MLCINCARLQSSRRRIQPAPQGGSPPLELPHPWLCVGCGAAVTDAIREQFMAKVRQLEQFGLGIDPLSTADPPPS